MILQHRFLRWRALHGRLLTIALALTCAAAPAARAAERLRVTDGRWLERADGTPFFYLGDTAWMLLQRLDGDETERYLTNRAGKGFTVIQAVVLWSEERRDLPNAGGDPPLVDRATLEPNEAYFRHVDAVVARGFLPSACTTRPGSTST